MEKIEDDKMSYQCSDCNALVRLGISDTVKCGKCGHRILYKIRSNQWTQYEAL